MLRCPASLVAQHPRYYPRAACRGSGFPPAVVRRPSVVGRCRRNRKQKTLFSRVPPERRNSAAPRPSAVGDELPRWYNTLPEPTPMLGRAYHPQLPPVLEQGSSGAGGAPAAGRRMQHVWEWGSRRGKGNVSKKSRHSSTLSKSDKFARSDGPSFSADDATKDPETVIFNHEKELPLSLVDIFKRKRGKISSKFGSLSKSRLSTFVMHIFVRSPLTGRLMNWQNRSLDGERVLPFMSMAANDVDELIEDIEIDEKSDGMIAAASNENASVDKKIASSYMPPIPPPVKQNTYKQYEDDDEDVDVERVDSEMVDIDLNGDVDIEQ
ncbi:hypothetical protein KSP39_PZI020066 [Platanthera zijinensis]|uniref:Uncharacterized protein n=1 Tax=Platanthera zijinensis TaxID=2320716 RepID=A0AAP0B0D9_9ASPA